MAGWSGCLTEPNLGQQQGVSIRMVAHHVGSYGLVSWFLDRRDGYGRARLSSNGLQLCRLALARGVTGVVCAGQAVKRNKGSRLKDNRRLGLGAKPARQQSLTGLREGVLVRGSLVLLA